MRKRLLRLRNIVAACPGVSQRILELAHHKSCSSSEEFMGWRSAPRNDPGVGFRLATYRGKRAPPSVYDSSPLQIANRLELKEVTRCSRLCPNLNTSSPIPPSLPGVLPSNREDPSRPRTAMHNRDEHNLVRNGYRRIHFNLALLLKISRTF